MGNRIVFEFLGGEDDEQWSRVRGVLEEAGAEAISEPGESLPHAVTAVLPDDADVDAVLDRLRSLPRVGRADRDAIREMFEPM